MEVHFFVRAAKMPLCSWANFTVRRTQLKYAHRLRCRQESARSATLRVRPSRNRDCEGATPRDVLLRCVPTELDSGRRLRRTLAAGNIALAVEAKGSRLVPERRASRALDAACTYDACARCSSEVRPRWATRASRQLIPSAIAHCSAIRRRASCGERSMTSPTRQLDISMPSTTSASFRIRRTRILD